MLTEEERKNVKEEEEANPSAFPHMLAKTRYICYVAAAVLGTLPLPML